MLINFYCRMFRTFKDDVKEEFRSSPSPPEAIMFLISQIDRRYKEKAVFSESKMSRIYSSNAATRDLNEEASFEINKGGCHLWNTVQESVNKLSETNRLSVVIGKGLKKYMVMEKRTFTVLAKNCVIVPSSRITK